MTQQLGVGDPTAPQTEPAREVAASRNARKVVKLVQQAEARQALHDAESEGCAADAAAGHTQCGEVGTGVYFLQHAGLVGAFPLFRLFASLIRRRQRARGQVEPHEVLGSENLLELRFENVREAYLLFHGPRYLYGSCLQGSAGRQDLELVLQSKYRFIGAAATASPCIRPQRASGCFSGRAAAKAGSAPSAVLMDRNVGYGSTSHLKRSALYICGTRQTSASVT